MSPVQLTKSRSMNGNSLERTRYFSRQLVTAADLTQDQDYVQERMRLHNRFLHGWGVVCGLEVTANATDEVPRQVDINSGYALSPQGDEIYVGEPVTIDLTEHCLDPAMFTGPKRKDAYLAIRYNERLTRPVRVQPAGCACADHECEYSRVQDTFEVRVLTTLPDTYSHFEEMPKERTPGWYEEFMTYLPPCVRGDDGELTALRPCPPSSSDPWVLLARITSNESGVDPITDEMIDNAGVRRYVISFGGLYLICPGQATMLSTPQVMMATTMAFTMGSANSLVDLGDAAAEVGPKATVVMRRENDTPIALHAAFRVDAEETLASLVRREGDRKLYDPVENRVYRLGELYAMAREEDLGTPVSNLLEALVPLEGLKIEATRLREAHRKLKEELDAQGFARLERDHAGAPAAASKLAVINLDGVGPKTPLGEEIANMPLADVANMRREEFVKDALKKAPPTRKAVVERLANDVWTRATGVVSLAESWRDRE